MTRRRNPYTTDARTYARLAHAASLPLVPKSELEALSDTELNTLGNAYEQAVIHLRVDIGEEETGFNYETDAKYLAAARPVYATIERYFREVFVPIENVRVAAKDKAWREAEAARLQKQREAKLRTAERKAAKLAEDEAAAGIITADRSSTRYHIGDEISGPKGWYEVTAIGDSDTHTLKAALAAGIPDKRVHSGAWILLEESDVQGPSRDALIVSIGKGVKLNPRRRSRSR